jgi:polysaccharide export outer membrane protein
VKRSIALLAVLAGALSACGATGPYVWAADVPEAAASKGAPIRPGDRLYLLVRGQEPLTGELPVRPDGAIVHPVFGKVDVAGLTTEEAARAVMARLTNIVVDPDVTVTIAATGPFKVSVVGEVAHPGPLEIDPSENMLHVLARAGGFTEFANKSGIFVIRQRPTNQRIRFRYGDLEGGDAKSLAFRLQDGDVVVVE